MPRYFTLLEAEALLPEVERLLTKLIQLRRDYESADRQLAQISQKIALSGGMAVSGEQIREIRSRKDRSAREMQEAMEDIQRTGCLLKDIETGLIDFPTLYRDREVYLCWKLGESGISFWHQIADGFRGRQGIDSEFLANHRGE